MNSIKTENISIYAENLITGRKYLFKESKVMPAASVIKLPVLICLYEFLNEKNISSDSYLSFTKEDIVPDSPFFEKSDITSYSLKIYDIAHSMITVSDNTSTNIIIDYLGIERINKFIKKIGMNNTILNRKMYDFVSREKGLDNFSTTEDMAIFFKYLLGKLAQNFNPFENLENKNIYHQALNIILEQEDLEKIPSGFLGKSFKVANKPGELPGIRNDASIIFTKDSKCIINIFTENVINETEKDIWIGKKAKEIFEELV